MNKILQFLCSNSNTLFSVTDFEHYYSFQEFEQSKLRNRIIQRLEQYRDVSYGESPEDILVKEEELSRMTYAILQLKEEIGVQNLRILMLRKGYGLRLNEIAKRVGVSYDYTRRLYSTNLKKARAFIKRALKDNVLDIDMFHSYRGYFEATTPMMKVNYPFDSARQSFKRTYKYGGSLKVMTTCKVPEYLDECFGDNKTICNYCGGQCTRMKTMEERI